jgi:hypothetical protein
LLTLRTGLLARGEHKEFHGNVSKPTKMTMARGPLRSERKPRLRDRASWDAESLTQSGIEHVRESDGGFLQLLPHNRGVRLEIGSVDVHSRWVGKLAG